MTASAYSRSVAETPRELEEGFLAFGLGDWDDIPSGKYGDCRFKLVHESGPVIVPFKAVKP